MATPEVKRVKGIYDVFLASYLRSHDFQIITTRKTNPYHLEICFESTPELEQAISDYFAKRDRTHALSFAEHYRSLRAMIQALKFGNSEGGSGDGKDQ
jgi:hypothetical protein